MSDRYIFQSGLVTDPSQNLREIKDLAVADGRIAEVSDHIIPEHGDKVINCDGLEIWPGLIDMHLHVADLYEVSTGTPYCAVEDGVTTALSPGAGNTFMTPALLGAEVDRGLPINVGAYLGAANVLATRLTDQELIDMFRGELPEQVMKEKMTRNAFTNMTAKYCIGIKEHMGHFILPDEWIERIYHITAEAGLLLMSHTQDPKHTAHMVELSKGRPLHLGHANAAGCGTHADAVDGMQQIIDFCRLPNVTGEFVTTMLRKGLGSREGLQMTASSRQVALDALADETVNILVSDGENHSTMKGFGDTRDNIPCILELAKEGVVGIMDAVAMMTCNPAEYIGKITGCTEWKEKFGNLKSGSWANITVVDPEDQLATYVMTGGNLTSFENRYLRSHGKAGRWVSKYGSGWLGVGDAAMYRTERG